MGLWEGHRGQPASLGLSPTGTGTEHQCRPPSRSWGAPVFHQSLRPSGRPPWLNPALILVLSWVFLSCFFFSFPSVPDPNSSIATK